MDDKELLELAAKAAGIEGQFSEDWHVSFGERVNDKTWGITFWVPLSGGTACWNPLTDDGDALRLAHKLGLLSDVPVWPITLEETRRAIVRAAAALVTPNAK